MLKTIEVYGNGVAYRVDFVSFVNIVVGDEDKAFEYADVLLAEGMVEKFDRYVKYSVLDAAELENQMKDY